ncbi:hypothetical protein VNO77_37261 [Canavalia gladiata]|uniref:Uncharacterized protein n=1 Tax=Canavalia gladiata TaxID=3824 RepID=A0AAN9KAN2_CANGL
MLCPSLDSVASNQTYGSNSRFVRGDIDSLTPIRRAENTRSYSWFIEIPLIHTGLIKWFIETHSFIVPQANPCKKGFDSRIKVALTCTKSKEAVPASHKGRVPFA